MLYTAEGANAGLAAAMRVFGVRDVWYQPMRDY